MPSEDDDADSALRLFRGASIVFFGLVLELGLAFVVKLLLARFFGRTGYGAISIGMTVMATVSTISLLGLHTGVGRYLPRYDDHKRRRGVLVSAFSMVLPVSVVAGAACFWFADLLAAQVFKDASLIPIIEAFSLIIPVNATILMTVGVMQGQEQSAPKVVIQNLGLPLSKFTVVGIGLAVGAATVSISWGYLIAYGAVSVLCLYYLFSQTPLFQRTEITPMYGELTSFSLPLLVSATMGLVLNSLDVFILGYVGTTGDVGVYKVVYPLAKLLTVSLGAFGFILLPILSEYHNRGALEQMGSVYRLASKWILIISLPIFFVYLFIPQEIITISFSAEYNEGWKALSVLGIGFLCHAIAGPNIDTLISLGKTRLVMLDNMTTAMVNIGLNLVLIPQYNYLGAAVATTISFFLLNLLSTVQLYRSVGVHPVSRVGVRLTIISVVLAFVCAEATKMFVTRPWFSVLAFGLLFGPLYLILVVAIGGVSEDELLLIDAIENKAGIELTRLRNLINRAQL